LKSAFRKEELLLARRQVGQIEWATCNQVFLDCPTYALFTPQPIDSKSPYFMWLCQQLDLPTWNTDRDLSLELQRGTKELNSSPEHWKLLQRYVFEALQSILPSLPEPGNPQCPSWISAILQLPIFPITSADGSNTIRRLSEGIFVPDSQLLNPHFADKVDILDFGTNHIWDILPVLHRSTVRIHYLSDYDKAEAMEVRVVTPTQEDWELSEIIRAKRNALTRYDHFRQHC
jgi:hypothetical protein